MAENTKVALLGTGIMGAAMARNLMGAGTEVRAWNRSTEKAEPLAGDGATVFEDPAGAASGADFLLTMLPDADVIEDVVGKGVLPALAEDGVWLQMSTVGEGATRGSPAWPPRTGSPTWTRRCWGRRHPQSRGS